MLPVKIDISDFVRQWNLTAEESDMFVYNVLDEIGIRFADQWRNLAGQELKQTKSQYQRAIYIEKPDSTSLIVGLAGWLPNAVEKGIGPFDMKKEAFMNSTKKTIKKDGGWFLTIPFRFGTPDIVGESTIFANVMPGKVYEVAKNVLRDRKSSLKFSQLPPEFQLKGVRPEVFNNQTGERFGAYQHKHSIYEGMKNLGREGHGHYMTFRRVSDLSDPLSWIHPGIKPANLMERTLQQFPLGDIIGQVKDDFLQSYR